MLLSQGHHHRDFLKPPSLFFHHLQAASLKLGTNVSKNNQLLISQAVYVVNHDPVILRPTFQLTRTNAIGFRSSVGLYWNPSFDQALASATFYSGKYDDYKTTIVASNTNGLSVKTKAKIYQGLLHSITAQLSTHDAPQVSVKSKFGGDINTKTSYNLETEVLEFSLEKNEKITICDSSGSSSNLSTTFHAEVPLGAFRADRPQSRPRVILGVKVACK